MADSKITALTSIGTSTDPVLDQMVIVDVSDGSMAATGTTKKVSLNQLLSSNPSATGGLTLSGALAAGSATITGDLTVRTNKLKVDSSGVGVNTTSTTLGGGVMAIEHASNNGLVVNSTAGSPTIYLRNIADSNLAKLLFTDSGLNFDTANGGTFATINSTGNFVLKGGTAAANGVGVTFPATQVASSNANCLDDYEEGTFTPTIAGSSSTGTGTYSVQTARYTKVGRLVTCEINITWSAHTGTGNLWISGLPFTPTSSVDGSVFCGILNNVALSAGYVATGYVASSVSSIVMHQYPTGGGASIPVPIDTAGAITVSAIYTV